MIMTINYINYNLTYGCLPMCNQGFHPACVSYPFFMLFHYIDILIKNVSSFKVGMIVTTSL